MTIKELPSEIVNQIAAGEVIENPSAVIKELIENSIDAKATQIEIDIEDSGKKRITIKDNGCGISREDLKKAPLRHATSKISSFDDLYNINTMGFRGEALASIFSISKAKIISKEEGKGAYEISSKDNEVKESGGEVGTCIHIEEIFYNTPARKKYLKSDTSELKLILEIVNRFELSNNEIKFTVKHNGKVIVSKPAFNTKEENIYYILGKDLKGKLFNLNSNSDSINLSGFIGKPALVSYGYRKNQHIFVNGRYVKSKLIRDAIYDGIGSNLMDSRHPLFVLFIEIDPEIIDVNIHPTKIEIKFENELQIYEEIRRSVNSLFETQESFKNFEEDTDLSEHVDSTNLNVISKTPIKDKDYFTKEKQKSFDLNEGSVDYEVKETVIETDDTSEEIFEKGPLFETLQDYKILGQLNKTYIVIETKDDMILVDQHIAEEKYFYENFKKSFEEKRSKSQLLLKSYSIHLSNPEMLMYKENFEVLHALGFETEEFGQNEILVRAVPLNIKNKDENPDKLKQYLYEVLVNKKIKCVEEENYEKIASMACRTAIMAGEELTYPQMRRMVENLKYLKQPFNCPHGRPTFLKFDKKDLNRKFKRI